MAIYQFVFLNGSGASPALDLVDCDDDTAAIALASRGLADHATCVGVEIFASDRLVMRTTGIAAPRSD
ncbi:MAG: hypothetical protein KKA16_03925 [Alphaproteobacteria bacterium]|nr:hypothetical protein [Alphaproteobacteria bacterium]MBU2378110.1 hypothetical protein [Alphaproteobacteria bacterium]